MRIDAPLISAHKLQRLHRWILLWLRWFAAFLAGAEEVAPFTQSATHVAHGWLDSIEQRLIDVVMLRALPHLRACRPPRHSPYRRKHKQFRRALIGAKLRRALRSKDLRTRIAKLSQDLNVLVAQMLKRLPLTRRRPIKPRPESRSVEARELRAASVACADTS